MTHLQPYHPTWNIESNGKSYWDLCIQYRQERAPSTGMLLPLMVDRIIGIFAIARDQ